MEKNNFEDFFSTGCCYQFDGECLGHGCSRTGIQLKEHSYNSSKGEAIISRNFIENDDLSSF